MSVHSTAAVSGSTGLFFRDSVFVVSDLALNSAANSSSIGDLLSGALYFAGAIFAVSFRAGSLVGGSGFADWWLTIQISESLTLES